LRGRSARQGLRTGNRSVRNGALSDLAVALPEAEMISIVAAW